MFKGVCVFLILCVSLCPLYGIWGAKIKTKKENLSLFLVKRGDFDISIKRTGQLKPEEKISIMHGLERSLKLIYRMREGVRVSKGEKLLEFDKTDIEKEIKQVISKRKKILFTLEIAMIELQKIRANVKAQMKKAKLDHLSIVGEFEKYKQYQSKLERKSKTIKIEESDARLQKLQKRITRLPKLIQEGMATQDEFARVKIEEKGAKRNLFKAKGELLVFTKYTFFMEMKKKENEVENSKRNLSILQKRLSIKMKHKIKFIADKKKELERLTRELKELENQLKRTTIKAPIHGLVIHGSMKKDIYSSRETLQLGKDTSGDTILITLPILHTMKAHMMLTEDKVYLIKKGMTCFLYPFGSTKRIEGIIEYVSEMVEQNEVTDEKGYRVRIKLKKQSPFSQPVIPVKIEIEIDSLKNILYIPKHTITRLGKKSFCFVFENGKRKKVEIVTGKENNIFIEVKKGLKENDWVYIGN